VCSGVASRPEDIITQRVKPILAVAVVAEFRHRGKKRMTDAGRPARPPRGSPQYSRGSKMVVANRSASVITQSFSPALVEL